VDKVDGTGHLEKGSWKRTAGKGQLGENSWERTDGRLPTQDKRGRTALTGQTGQDVWDMTFSSGLLDSFADYQDTISFTLLRCSFADCVTPFSALRSLKNSFEPQMRIFSCGNIPTINLNSSGSFRNASLATEITRPCFQNSSGGCANRCASVKK
jgi:hypothetical protein